MILGFLFAVAPSTLCRWNSLRHRSQNDSQGPKTMVYYITNTVIPFLDTRRRASLFLTCNMLKSRILQIFETSISRQIMDAAIRTPRWMKERYRSRRLATCPHAHIKSTDLVRSKNEFRLRDTFQCVCGCQLYGIPHQHHPSHGKCLQTLPSRLCAWRRATASDLSHHCDRMKWRMCHRFTRSEKRRVEVARTLLQTGFSLLHLYHYRQHQVRKILHRMKHRALARTAGDLLAWGIAQSMLEIVVSYPARANGIGHKSEPPVSVKGMYTAMRQAFTQHRAAPGR